MHQNNNEGGNEPIDGEGQVIIHDDNAVSEEVDFVEPSEDKVNEELLTGEDTDILAVVVVVYNHVEGIDGRAMTRFKRTNAGAGVDRIYTCL